MGLLYGTLEQTVLVYKNKVANIQQKFTKKLFYKYNLPILNYNDIIDFLCLMQLSHPRLRSDLILVYKLINNPLDHDGSLLSTYTNNNRGSAIKL